MRLHHLLALIPVLLSVAGVLLDAPGRPLVLGVPFLLAWVVGTVLATAAVMALVFRLDPDNHEDE